MTKKVANMSKEELTRKILAIEVARAALFEQIAPLQERTRSLYDELKPLQERLGEINVAEAKAGGGFDFDLILMAEPKSQAEYQEAERQTSELGFFLRGGYYPATMQTAMRIALTESNLEKTINAIETILPHIIPMPKDLASLTAGTKVFAIFERGLSEYASYQLCVKDDGSAFINVLRHGRESVESTFKTIREAVEYVQEHLWYERSDRQEQSEED